MPIQTVLDFTGGNDASITFKCKDGLKNMILSVASDLNMDVSTYIRECMNERAFADAGRINLLKERGQKVFVDMPKA